MVAAVNDQNGSVSSRGTLNARVAGMLDNRGGSLSGAGASQLSVGNLNNGGGRLSSQASLSLDLNRGHQNAAPPQQFVSRLSRRR